MQTSALETALPHAVRRRLQDRERAINTLLISFERHVLNQLCGTPAERAGWSAFFHRLYLSQLENVSMASQTTGRPLDQAGQPTEGPALEIDPDGRAMELFSDSPRALASSPGMGMWSTILRYPDPSETGAPAMLIWLSPEASTLPAHVHTSRTETFRPLSGELTVVVDDAPHRLGVGDEFTVEPGDAHYFRNDTDDFVAFQVDVPWKRTIDTQYMTAGLDHEGYFGADGGYGEPDFVQGLLLAEYVREETRITIAPHVVQRVLWASVARIARLTGREAMDERYLRDRFWESNVEQPDI